MALVTADVLREYLPEISGTGVDTELNSLLARVESALARWLGYPSPDGSNTPTLDVSTYTLYVDSPDFDDISRLYLPLKPIVSITSIYADVDREYTSDTEITSSEYELDKQNGIVILKPNVSTVGFVNSYRGNRVIGTFGFTSFHKDIVHAICVYASQLQRAKSSQGKKSATTRQTNTTYLPNSIPDEVKQILYPYRCTSLLI
jgi:hypothetical protein